MNVKLMVFIDISFLVNVKLVVSIDISFLILVLEIVLFYLNSNIQESNVL